MIGFSAAIFFHGGIAIGAFVFILIVLISNIVKTFNLLRYNRIKLRPFLGIIVILGFGWYYMNGNINIPKLGTFNYITDVMKNFPTLVKSNVRGDASYNEWLIPKSINEIIFKAPVKLVLFLFSPFPWDIKKYNQLIGLFDSVLYMYISYLILRNIKTIWADKTLRTILFIIISYLLIFSIVVGNFGTSIRHRVKFFIPMLLLIGPFLPKFIFSRKKSLSDKTRLKIYSKK